MQRRLELKNKIITDILLVSLLLTSCAPATTPAPNATVTPEPTTPTAPTITTTPVTYIPGLSTSVPEPDPAFIENVANENYLKVMSLTMNQVVLTYKEHTSIDSQPYVVMVDDSTGVPLAVYIGGSWQKSTLKFFGSQVGIVMGKDTVEPASPQEIEVMSEFSMATIQVGNEWDRNEPTQGNYDMDYSMQTEQVVNYLKEAGITEIIAHPLTTAGHASWIEKAFTKDELREIMKKRVQFFINNNPDAWGIVVVNEPNLLNPLMDGRIEDVYFQMWGNNDYVVEFFETVHEIDPDKKLIFNDTDNHRKDGGSTESTREVVRVLHEKGLVDYVGMEMHLNQWCGVQDGVVDKNTILEQIDYYHTLGVPVLFTELTYEPTAAELQMAPVEFNARLASIFEQVIEVAIQSGNVMGVTFWGVTDKYLKDVNWYQIFDENAQPKLAYYVVLRTLYEGIK